MYCFGGNDEMQHFLKFIVQQLLKSLTKLQVFNEKDLIFNYLICSNFQNASKLTSLANSKLAAFHTTGR